MQLCPLHRNWVGRTWQARSGLMRTARGDGRTHTHGMAISPTGASWGASKEYCRGPRLSGHLLFGLKRDVIAQRAFAAPRRGDQSLFVPCLKRGGAEIAGIGVVTQHVRDDHQSTVADGDDG